ncbi:tetratricopeptide repeat protein [Sorangium sp. So ce448]|uniref:tetratricopeptide repeat protein n=1 Tax=Sorangium sp. So ce448 TaxID=3133314 RepID=UPI003F5E0477
MRSTTSSADSAAERRATPGDEAAPEEPGDLERILGPERGAAYRRFLEWSVGEGFMLAVVEVRRPVQREALAAATRAAVPSLCIARLTSVGAQPIRTFLEEACPSPEETSVLMLTRLEESDDAARICAALNVHRDELARRFALPWVVVVHPAAALALQRHAPDFCDFAGLWLPEEPGEAMDPILDQAFLSPTASFVAPHHLGADPTRIPKGLLSLAHEAAVSGHVDQAADLLAQHDMKHPDARAHDARRVHVDGVLLAVRGELTQALARFHAALKLCEATNDATMRAVLLNEVAQVHALQGDLAAARRFVQAALELFEKLGNQRGRAASLQQLSIIEGGLGDNAKAQELARESLQLIEELGDQVGRAASLLELSFIEARMGNHAKAQELARESLALGDTFGNLIVRFASLHRLATLAIRQGNHSEARELLDESLKLSEKMGSATCRLAVLRELGNILCLEGNFAEARDLWRESLKISEELGVKSTRATSLMMLGIVEAVQGQTGHGLALVREGIGILEEINATAAAKLKDALRGLETISSADLSDR